MPERRFPVVTTILVVVCIAVFVFELTLPRYGITRQGFHAKMGVVPFELAHGYDVPPADLVPWWATVGTALFIHGGWLHLVVDVLYLWVFGVSVETRLGSLRFFVLYLVCAVAATGVQVAASAGSAVPVIGASGAISGVLGAYLVLGGRVRALTTPAPGVAAVVPLPAWVLLVAWFGLQALQGALALGYAQAAVALLASAAGFVAGMVLGAPLDRTGRRPSGGAPGVHGAHSV